MAVNLKNLKKLTKEDTNWEFGLSNVVAKDSGISVIKIEIIDPSKNRSIEKMNFQISLSFSNEGKGEPHTKICTFNSTFWAGNVFSILAKVTMDVYEHTQKENSLHFTKPFRLNISQEHIEFEYRRLEKLIKDLLQEHQFEGFRLV